MIVPPQRNKSHRLLAIGVLALFTALVVCGVLAVRAISERNSLAEARKLANPVPATAAALSAGKQVYEHHCQSCHGAAGDGKGQRAQNLSVIPSDFTNARKMARTTDGELFWVTTKGRRPMPAFEKKLSDEERWQVVDYVRRFAPQARGK